MKSFFASMITMFVLDFCWIGLIMNKFYHQQMGPLLRLKSNGALNPIWWAAALIYVLIPMGVVLFVIPKISESKPIWSILPWGFFYGLIIYGVYDFTNYSLLKDWNLTVTLVDFIWGGVLCAGVSMVGLWFSRLTF